MTDDLRYEPDDSHDWLSRLRPRTVLVVGEIGDDERDRIRRLAPDVRSAVSGPFATLLHRGAYAFRSGDEWHAVVVARGAPTSADAQRRRYTEGGHLLLAALLHEQDWTNAPLFAGSARYSVGAVVRPKGLSEVGRITRIEQSDDGYEYHVDVRGQTQRYDEDALILEQGDPKDPRFWLTQTPAPARDIGLTLTWTKLRHPLTDTLYSFASSKTVFRAYQFKPVLKMLTASSMRLLVADEVGLGKTIEAGLIWSELEQRMPLDRVLVVAPAALTLKWQTEMSRRFDRRLEVLRKADLMTFVDGVEAGNEPPLHGVVSLESLRRLDDVLEALTRLNPRFDLVIVDEAHYLRNRMSKSHAMGQVLEGLAEYLVFLSATPLNLGNDDLFNLMGLLDEEHFGDRAIFAAQLEPNEILNDVARQIMGDGGKNPTKLAARLDELAGLEFGSEVIDRPDFEALRNLVAVDRPLDHEEIARARRLLADLNVLGGVFTRTRKAEVPGDKAVRQPENIDVVWTQEEKAYYDAVYAWYMARALKLGTPPGFAMQMPLRQAASCLRASQAALISKEPGLVRQGVDDFDDDGEGDADVRGLVGNAVLGRPLTVDTKYDRLLERLLTARAAGLQQAMIFSFFRGTLSYLANRLQDHFSVRVMHGLVPMRDRERIMREFRAGEFEILLLSEVGSEGLDFEFCNVLVNYDLPWNPMRVEQRIGRLDRFGQQHEKIFIYNMRVPGTIETDIFQRLYDRIGVFERSIGELEPILRDEIGEITKRLLDPRLDAEGRRREADRVAVAMKKVKHDLDELRASEAHLSGMDSLLIDGLTDAGPGRGRFVGPTEIQLMLDKLFGVHGGRRTATNSTGVYKIFGSATLADQLRQSTVGEGGSRYSRPKLAALLQDGHAIECTSLPEVASTSDVELVSSRHPLVKLALESFGDDALALPRFGSVSVPGLRPGSRYLVTIDLATTTGLRPQLELWAEAVDLTNGHLDGQVGDAVLTALAAGTLGDGATSVPGDINTTWTVTQKSLSRRRRATQSVRAQENAALVDGRIKARESSIGLMLTKRLELVDRMIADNSDPSIVRLHKGSIRNLRIRRDNVRAELEPRKELSLSLTAVAVLLVEPAEPTPSRGTRA